MENPSDSLPSIPAAGSHTISNPHSPRNSMNIYSTGIFTQSPSTLNRSVIHWSFNKEKRFKTVKNVADDVIVPNLGTTLGKRSTSFGRGDKWSPKGKEGPAPDSYFPIMKKSREKIPGIRFEKSKSGRTVRSTQFLRIDENPGPGTYKINRGLLADNKGFMMKSRVGNAYPSPYSPPATSYTPKSDLTKNSRFSCVSFGLGSRSDFTVKDKSIPGPGAYKIKSPFDKKPVRYSKSQRLLMKQISIKE